MRKERKRSLSTCCTSVRHHYVQLHPVGLTIGSGVPALHPLLEEGLSWLLVSGVVEGSSSRVRLVMATSPLEQNPHAYSDKTHQAFTYPNEPREARHLIAEEGEVQGVLPLADG